MPLTGRLSTLQTVEAFTYMSENYWVVALCISIPKLSGGSQMKGTIISAIYYGLNHNLYVGIIIVVVALGTISTETLVELYQTAPVLPCGFKSDFIITLISSAAFVPFITIAATLPMAGSYVDDVKSKFARYCIFRKSYFEYLVSRFVTCFLSGGTVIVLGIFTTYLISYIILLPIEQAVDCVPTKTNYELASRCFVMFLNGGLWAVIGMAMSTLFESKYIAFASPFVIYYLLVILYERYFPDVFLLYPPNWANPSIWPYTFWGEVVFLLELTLAFGVLFVIRAERRIREL